MKSLAYLLVALLILASGQSAPCQDADTPEDATAPPANSTAPQDDTAQAPTDQTLPQQPFDIIPVEVVTFHPCAIRVPDDYDPARSYPLVIGLHGFGSNAERFLTNYDAFADPQFIYAVPQAPYISPQPGWIGYSWILFDTGNLEMEFQTMQNSMDYIVQVKELVSQRYKISDVYLLGFSQGGTLAYRAALANPGRFAGVACIAAPLDEYYATPEALAAIKDMRVFIAHGTQDDTLPIEYSRDARDAFTANGNDVQDVEFEGGHTFDAQTLKKIENWILHREDE